MVTSQAYESEISTETISNFPKYALYYDGSCVTKILFSRLFYRLVNFRTLEGKKTCAANFVLKFLRFLAPKDSFPDISSLISKRTSATKKCFKLEILTDCPNSV